MKYLQIAQYKRVKFVVHLANSITTINTSLDIEIKATILCINRLLISSIRVNGIDQLAEIAW